MAQADPGRVVGQRAEIAYRKRVVRQHARERGDLRRQQRRRWWRCFWIRPLGHAWVELPDVDPETGRPRPGHLQCVGCEKTRRAR